MKPSGSERLHSRVRLNSSAMIAHLMMQFDTSSTSVDFLIRVLYNASGKYNKHFCNHYRRTPKATSQQKVSHFNIQPTP